MLYKNLKLELLEHDTLRLTTDKHLVCYADPYRLPSGVALPKADVLLITHPHHDHCSIEDIAKVVQPSTIIITVADVQSKLATFTFKELHIVVPHDTVSFDDTGHEVVEVAATPAYNKDKQFHPKENQWVGFIITIDGTSVYFAGDTDLIPEMASLPRIDVAFLPVSGTYVMTAQEAAQAAGLVKPQLAVPMHYGAIVGTKDDAAAFKKAAPCKVEVLR